MIATLALSAAFLLQATKAEQESAYYNVDHFPTPGGVLVEAGGMDFLPDGTLMVSTRRGQVWTIENPLAADPKDAKFRLFAEGLQEGLGLKVVNGEIFVLQRGELSKLRDTNGDGVCDRIETIANDWGLSGHYHEFAFGLPRDRDGNFYISLNVSFGNPQWWAGRSTVPYRGWVMKITPAGKTIPFASGLRSPCGLGLNAEGDLFLTDNQGDWMPACPIFHVQEGKFYGHPASLDWTEEYRKAGRHSTDTDPPERERANAAAWIPYDWSRSAGSLVADQTGGKFGPFANQLFVAELTNGLVFRAQLEKVNGEYQGAVFPFRSQVGSAIRVCFAPDGTLFAGCTERGWGGQSPGDGITRIRWTGKAPFEMKTVHLLADGFEVELTKPLAADVVLSPETAQISQYDYDYFWEYGSPAKRQRKVTPTHVSVSADRRTLAIRGADLKAGMVARMRLVGLRAQSGEPLLHDEMAYTINALPGQPAMEQVAKLATPPQEKQRWDEEWIYLTKGDPLDAWIQGGWRTGDVKLDPDDAKNLLVSDPPAPKEGETPPSARLINLGGKNPSELVSRFEFGDAEVHVDFMIPKGGNSGVYLMGKYEVQIRDCSEVKDLKFGDLGGIYEGWGAGNRWPGKAPMFNAFRGPGEWHGMDIRFQAPRFDAAGKKIANARIERVMVDDVLLQENVEIVNPTRGAFEGPETAVGPLRLQGDHGPVAYKGIRIKARNLPKDDEGWVRIFNGKDLEGWKISDNGKWRVEDGQIVGTGDVSHLFSPRGDYKDLEFRAKVKINDGGNSGMYFRAKYGPGWPAGYEAQVNSTHKDPVKTGSIYGLSLIKTQLIPADAWFEQHIVCRDEPEGTHITIRVNGIVVNDFLDKERKHAIGHVAFQQHNEGSEVRYKDVEVRELVNAAR